MKAIKNIVSYIIIALCIVFIYCVFNRLKEEQVDKENQIISLLEDYSIYNSFINDSIYSGLDTTKIYYRFFSYSCKACIAKDTASLFSLFNPSNIILHTNYIDKRINYNRSIKVKNNLIAKFDAITRPYLLFYENKRWNIYFPFKQHQLLNDYVYCKIKSNYKSAL